MIYLGIKISPKLSKIVRLNFTPLFITKYYWENEKPEIKWATLQNPKHQGGLGAPHFFHYFLANQLKFVLEWRHHNQSDSTWIDIYIKKTLCDSVSDLPCLSKSIKHHPCFKALTIKSTLTAWWKSHEIMETIPAPSHCSPVWNNPNFSNSTWVSLSYLVEKNGIERNDCYEYLLIKILHWRKIKIFFTLNCPP